MKKYNTYKQTKLCKIEGLEEIPAHWYQCALKWVTKRYAGGTPNKDNPEYWNSKDIPWLNSGSVNQKDIKEASDYISNLGFKKSSAKWIPKDSLVMALAGQGKTKGMVGYLRIKTTCNQSLAAIIPSKMIYARFLYWWLDSKYKSIRALASGDGRDGLNLEMIGNIECLMPPFEEQKKISEFLDKKTQEIDKLISKKEEFINLLSEKRTALITHSVTKGINPDIKYKPSGVEWLEQIPEHWSFVQFPHHVDFQEGPGILANDFMTEGIPLIRISGVKGPFVTLDGCNYLSPEKVKPRWNHFRLRKDDLLISCSASVGITAKVTEESVGAIPYTGLIRLRPRSNKISYSFIEWITQSGLYKNQIDVLKTGSIMQHYGPIHLRQIKITLPPIEEQNQITIFLDKKTQEIDGLIKKTQETIDKLKEYRMALITEAVTGKIKVAS